MPFQLTYTYEEIEEPPTSTYEQFMTREELQRRVAELQHMASVIPGSIHVHHIVLTDCEIAAVRRAIAAALVAGALSCSDRQELVKLLRRM